MHFHLELLTSTCMGCYFRKKVESVPRWPFTADMYRAREMRHAAIRQALRTERESPVCKCGERCWLTVHAMSSDELGLMWTCGDGHR